MKSKSFINQLFTLLLSVVILAVAGGKFWSDNAVKDSLHPVKTLSKGPVSQQADAKAPIDKAIVSELSLNAVITPSLSFDFFQGFYILPEPIWHVLENSAAEVISYAEPHFVATSFSRLFACYIVTNAP